MTESDVKSILEPEKLSDQIHKEISGQLLMNGDEIDIEKLGKIYEIAKSQEREDSNSEKQLELKAEENRIREEELKTNRSMKFLDNAVRIGIAGAFMWLTLATQKRDQDFQKSGFGYDNETSKRAGNVLGTFKNLF